jgi:prolipoprotein diacylglyceryltransferase
MAFVLPNSLGVRARRIPTQILEALLAATLLLSALFVRRQVSIPGTLFLMVVAAYATGRFFLDFVREKQRARVRLTSAQWISVVAFVSSGSALAICWLA